MQLKSKSELLGDINKKKEIYLLLTQPLADKKAVARRYCSECDRIFDVSPEEFAAFKEAMGGDQKVNSEYFFPNYYFETEGCGGCRSTDNPPDNFFIRSLNALVLQVEDLKVKLDEPQN
jgi:hypothetical protein